PTTDIYTLSLHDALPISARIRIVQPQNGDVTGPTVHVKAELSGGTIVPLTDNRLRPNGGHIHLLVDGQVQTMGIETERDVTGLRSEEHTSELQSPYDLVC